MCQHIVGEVWNKYQGRSFYEKVSACADVLSEWGRQITGSFKNRIQACKRVIKSLKGRRDDTSVHLIKENQKNLAEIYAQQETFWKQRSKQLWLKEGDKNSRFFHAAAKNRRATNQIKNLKNSEGVTVDWSTGLEDVITSYFTSLFTATNTEWSTVIDRVLSKVNEEQNASMLAEVTDKEVKSALFNMDL